MEFKHDKSWESLKTIFYSNLTAKDAWNKFIDIHEQEIPKPYWTTLRHLDVDKEQAEITQWFQQLAKENHIPYNIKALWIGIIKYSHNEKEIPAIYLAGADTYDNNDIDWACEPIYLPKNRYVQLDLLQQIDDTAKTDKDNYGFLDWILPLAYCAFTFDEIIRTKLDKKLFLTSNNKLFVAVGHDDGDYMNLSSIEIE